MPITVRLSDPLTQDASAYCRRVGLSLNALIAVALRDYLDARSGAGLPRTAAAAAPQPPGGEISRADDRLTVARPMGVPGAPEGSLALSRAERRRAQREQKKVR